MPATTLLAWLVGTAAGVLPPAGPASDPGAFARRIELAQEGLDKRHCAKSLPAARELAAAPAFASALDDERALRFLLSGARCALREDESAIALEFAEVAAPRARREDWPHSLRFHMGLALDRIASARDGFLALAVVAPNRVRDMEYQEIWRLLRGTARIDEGGDSSLAVLEVLARIHYAPPAPGRDDMLRLLHVRLLLQRGRIDEARRRMQGVVMVEALARVRIEKLFDPLRGDPALEPRLDLEAAAAEEVARTQALVEKQPKLLEAVNELVQSMHVAGRQEEGVAAADAALARLEADPAAYTDAAEQLPWLWNRRGYLLYDLGRVEEGRASLQEAAKLPEHGERNVSNMINYLLMQVAAGEAAEVLARLGEVGDASPYGRAFVELARTCAAAQLGDAAAQSQGLDYLRGHQDDNPHAYTHALLCVDDLDGAAAHLVERLAHRDRREEALMALQGSPEPADAVLPFRRLLRGRLEAVRARPEVRAAAERVGRIESLPVHAIGGGL